MSVLEQVFKDWFLGIEDEVFVLDGHQGVRHQAAPPHEASWQVRGQQYADFSRERSSLGLPADIYQTEPDFLMQPLVHRAAESTTAEPVEEPLEAKLAYPLEAEPHAHKRHVRMRYS